MLPGDLCVPPATTAPGSLLATWLGLCCQPVSCLAVLHWPWYTIASPGSAGRDSGERRRTSMRVGVGVLSEQ